jgi:bilirubin oxidase
LITAFSVQAQNPYSHFDNPLFIPDTLSTWPPDEHSVIHLDVMEDSMILFPNGSPINPVVPGFAWNPADNLPIRTLTYSNPETNNPGILGPTLIWYHGDSVTMEVQNHLDKKTTTHWHGAHVAPGNDGGPHQVIDPGKTWSPSFQIRDDVSTMWYHPHLHHHTQQQVQCGMAGMIIVKNVEDDKAKAMPHDYGLNDFPIILQDKFVQYDPATNRDTINYCCSLGTIPMVNGTWKPSLEVPDDGLVRFRILNGSSERTMALSLQYGTDPNLLIPFFVIGSDAGYLNEPYLMNYVQPQSGNLNDVLIIMGGERYEIVFDPTGLSGDSLFLVNRRDWMTGNKLITTFAGGPSYDNPPCYSGSYPMPPMTGQNMMNDPCASDNPGWMVPSADFDSLLMPLLKILPVPMPNGPAPIYGIPAFLANYQAPDPSTASVTRVKNLVGYNPDGGPPFSIDSINFDLEFINDYIDLGTTEIWDIYNSSGVAHPFHVHDIHFFITQIEHFDANGNVTNIPVPPYMRGPKDVMAVTSDKDSGTNGNSPYPQVKYRMIATFEDFGIPSETDSLYKYGYMYHCHILDHEDAGMMHQFVVVSTPFTGVEETVSPEWVLFPNPTTGRFAMKAEYEGASTLQLLSGSGALLKTWQMGAVNGLSEVEVDMLPAGIYFVRWLREDGESTKRIVITNQ